MAVSQTVSPLETLRKWKLIQSHPTKSLGIKVGWRSETVMRLRRLYNSNNNMMNMDSLKITFIIVIRQMAMNHIGPHPFNLHQALAAINSHCSLLHVELINEADVNHQAKPHQARCHRRRE